jgi:hypothetical protein
MTEREDEFEGVRELRQMVLDHSVRVLMDGETPVPRVSVHFFGVQQVGELTADELATAIKKAEHGWYANVSAERMLSGPSYIELGAWIGDQGDALALIGLGELVGLWRAFTPEVLGVEGEDAEKMAGVGYVMVMGTEKTKEALAA